MASHYVKQNQQTVRDYIAAGGVWPAKKVELAEWAIANNRWKPSREDIRRMCGESLAEAMREEVFVDDNGRTIRSKIPAKTTRDGEQGTFWHDLRTAPVSHIRIGVTQRRNGIVAECYHLYNVVRYSNERHTDDQIELVLNFTNDVRELDQPPKPKRAKERVVSVPSSNDQSPPAERSLRVVRGSTSRRGPSPPSVRLADPAPQQPDLSGKVKPTEPGAPHSAQ